MRVQFDFDLAGEGNGLHIDWDGIAGVRHCTLSLSLLLILSLIIWFSSLQFPDALDLASTAYIPIHVSSLSLFPLERRKYSICMWKWECVCIGVCIGELSPTFTESPTVLRLSFE